MNNKHRKTLRLLTTGQEKANVSWRDIESLFHALGAVVSEREGSRVAVLLNGVAAVFHSPHPLNETDKGALKSVRRFLENAGVRS